MAQGQGRFSWAPLFVVVGLCLLGLCQPGQSCWNRLPLPAKALYSPWPRPLVPIFEPVAIERPGWPRMIGSDLNCSKPALVDLDGDGQLDIVLGSPSNPTPYMALFHDALWAFRPDGRLVNGFPALLEDSGCSSPAVGDVNSDGRPEIIVGSSTNNLSTDRKAYGFDSQGRPLPGWPLLIAQGEKRYVFAAPCLGDLDGDGVLESVFGSRNGLLYACKADGSAVGPNWPVNLKTTPFSGIGSSPALGDIDNDGWLDIVVYLSDGLLYALNADGSIKRGWPRRVGANMTWGFPALISERQYQAEVICCPLLCDVDGDRLLEIVFVANMPQAALFLIDHDGSIRPGFPVVLREDGQFDSCRSTPAIADVDGDGRRDFVIWTDLGKLWVISGDGSVLKGWPKRVVHFAQGPIGKGIFKPSFPSVVDIDYDGQLEVLAPGWSEEVPVLWAFEADGEPVGGWPIELDRHIVNLPTVDDIDRDGSLELVLAIQGEVHCLGIPRYGSNIRPALPWRMFLHDPFRTGNAHAWLPELSCGFFERKTKWSGPDSFRFFVNYCDDDGDVPAVAELLLLHPDGRITTHKMTYSPGGTPGESAWCGRYSVSLELAQPGEYQFSFHFWDGYRFHYRLPGQTDEVFLPGPHQYLPGPFVAERGPTIQAAGWEPSRLDAGQASRLRLLCVVTHPMGAEAIDRVELFYNGLPTGIYLTDDGANGDDVAGDSIFTHQWQIAAGTLVAGKYLVGLVAWDKQGRPSQLWPVIPGDSGCLLGGEEPRLCADCAMADEQAGPQIRLGGCSMRKLAWDQAPKLRFIALVTHCEGPVAVESVRVLFNGIWSGLLLFDDGSHGDETAGDSVFTLVVDAGSQSGARGALLSLLARDVHGNESDLFPYLWVNP